MAEAVRLFETGDKAFRTKGGPQDIFDLDVFDRELKNLTARIKALPQKQVLINPPRGLVESLSGTNDQITQTQKFLGDVEDREAEAVKKGETFSINRTLYFELLRFGTLALLYDLMQKRRVYGQAGGFSPQMEEAIALKTFGITGSLLVRFGTTEQEKGIALVDFVGKNPQTQTTAAFFQFLVDSVILRTHGTYDQTLSQQTPLFQAYPNMGKNKINTAAWQVTAINNLSTDTLDQFAANDPLISENGEITRQALKYVKAVMNRFSEARKQLMTDLVASVSEENLNLTNFLALRQALEPYLQQGEPMDIYALHPVFRDDTQALYFIYNSSCFLAARTSEHADFYKLLADSIKKYAQALPEEVDVWTVRELPILFSAKDTIEQKSEKQVLKPADFESLVHKLHTLSNKTAYKIKADDEDPLYKAVWKQIEWGEIIPPQAIRIVFDPNNHKYVGVIFDYEPGTPFKSFGYSINTTKHRPEFSWKFLEPPTELESFQAAYERILITTKSILEHLTESIQSRRKKVQETQVQKNRPDVEFLNHEQTPPAQTNHARLPAPAAPPDSLKPTPLQPTTPEGISKKYRIGVLTQIHSNGLKSYRQGDLTAHYLAATTEHFAPNNKYLREALDNVITILRFNPYNEGTKQLTDKHITLEDGTTLPVRECTPGRMHDVDSRHIPDTMRILYVVRRDKSGVTNVILIGIDHKEHISNRVSTKTRKRAG